MDYIITFIQIVFKGCRESSRIKTVIVTGLIIAIVLFVPYWVGLLVIHYLDITIAGVAWPVGLAALTAITALASVIGLLYIEVRTMFN